MAGGGVTYSVILFRKSGIPLDVYNYMGTPEGLQKAREKRAELMARYLDNEVKLITIKTTQI